MTLQNTNRPSLKWRGYEISPVVQAFRFVPFPQFGMIWNRPVGVRVQTPQGETQYLPVYDLTRMLQIIIVLGGLLFFFLKIVSQRRSA
ncbi:hypothetical protein BECAL_02792 [Bellilinea caldifistulae]|uniref:Uncharacterized protein n=1 Tax=Bellilinea caldifistulae TaxID=360411 RepID=A0A0P6XZ66_9CHLR|nr:hypothetical protein [Bellilinea caldifistulae]KPL74425.1 hypothetical protein AC812_11385 [Bellilinea caldifistulae]GAP11602.1 hypothetical protein BECAL_02792 [Bellilinea caldifistulae]